MIVIVQLSITKMNKSFIILLDKLRLMLQERKLKFINIKILFNKLIGG